MVLGVLASLTIILQMKREQLALLFLYYGCLCSESLPHGAVALSARQSVTEVFLVILTVFILSCVSCVKFTLITIF